MAAATVFRRMSAIRHACHRHPRPWTAWTWASVAWLWIAQAVFRQDAPASSGPAQAGFGSQDALHAHPPDAGAATLFFPAALPAPSPLLPDAQAQKKQLSTRHAHWAALHPALRQHINNAANHHAANWKTISLASTGEASGSAADLAFAFSQTASQPETAFHSTPHFIIGNGSRSPDGSIEATAAPLESDAITIALVGDPRTQAPTSAQLRAITELVDYLRAKTGVLPVAVGPELSHALSLEAVLEAFGTSRASALAAAPPPQP